MDKVRELAYKTVLSLVLRVPETIRIPLAILGLWRL
jgi:hypothetical protein